MGMLGMQGNFAARLIVSTSLLTACLLGSVPPAQAGDAWASTSLGSIQLSVMDAEFETTGCIEVPIVAVVTTYDSRTRWSIFLQARRVGAEVSSYASLTGDGSSAEVDGFFTCPVSGAGAWIVTGEIRMLRSSPFASASAAIGTSFNIAKASTKTVITRLKQTKTSLTVHGRVTSRSAADAEVGARGDIVIEARARSSSRWVQVASTYSLKSGRFSADISRSLDPGSRLRAVFEGSDAAQRSMSTPVRAPDS